MLIRALLSGLRLGRELKWMRVRGFPDNRVNVYKALDDAWDHSTKIIKRTPNQSLTLMYVAAAMQDDEAEQVLTNTGVAFEFLNLALNHKDVVVSHSELCPDVTIDVKIAQAVSSFASDPPFTRPKKLALTRLVYEWIRITGDNQIHQNVVRFLLKRVWMMSDADVFITNIDAFDIEDTIKWLVPEYERELTIRRQSGLTDF